MRIIPIWRRQFYHIKLGGVKRFFVTNCKLFFTIYLQNSLHKKQKACIITTSTKQTQHMRELKNEKLYRLDWYGYVTI